jgi:aryl-alcohol dehydrogenase-like predicted oxidoreductase
MHYRRFGREELQVSEIGLGCWQLGAEWGEVDDATAAAVLDTALERGVTFFDTADVYGLGRSEQRIADFLRRHGGPEIMVATKLGRFPEPGWPHNFTLDVFRQHTEASLKRLGVECLDLTQVHCLPFHLLQEGEIFDWLRTLKQEGKIRRFGFSVETMDEAILCLEQAPDDLASLQIIFNIFRQKPIDVLFPRAKELGVALIVRLPLASGLLSGRFTPETTFPPNDHRHFNRDGDAFNVGETFAGLEFQTGLRLVERLRPLVPSEWTMAQFALRFCLDFDAVTTVIPGATKPEQVVANATASDLPELGMAIHAELEQLYEHEVVAHIRGPY